MFRTIAIIVGWIVLALILINVAMHVLGMFMALAMVLGLLLLIGAPIFLFFKFGRSKKTGAVAAPATRIYEPDGCAKLFSDEPTPTLLLTADSAMLPEHFELENDTIIQIVAENDRHAVKVRVKSGAYKGKTGWVSRASIVR
jgi:hypothetical protein